MKRAARVHRRRWGAAAVLLLGLPLLVRCGQARDRPAADNGAEPRATAEFERGPGGASEPSPFDRARELTSEGLHEQAARENGRLAAEFALAGDRQRQWRALVEQARALYRIPDQEAALRVLRDAAELADGRPDRESETAYHQAVFLHEMGRLEEALEAAARARDWAERTGDPRSIDRGYGVLATVYSLMGRYEESLAIDEELVDRFRRVQPDPPSLARTLNEVGIDYKHLGRFDDARLAYEEALEFFRREGPDRWLRIVLYNLSNLYSELGDEERSLALKLEVLRLLEGTNDRYGLGLVLDGIAKAYGDAGNRARARGYFARAIAVGREYELPYVLSASLIGLANVELADGNGGPARELLLEAVSLSERTGFGFQAADARIVMARTMIELGDAEEALRWAEAGVRRATATGDPNLRLQSVHAHALVLHALGRRAEAAREYEKAISLLESWRGRLAMGDLRMGLAEPRIDVYEDAIENLMDLDRAAAAFTVAERARARLLLELLADRRGEKPRDRRQQLLRRVKQRFAAAASTPVEGKREEIEREIKQLIAELETFEDSARASDPVTAAALHPQPLTADRARLLLTSPERALIAFFWGERNVYGWWLGTDGIRGATLGPAEELGARIEFLRAAVERPDAVADWRLAAWRAYRALVAPLRPVDVDELLVLPDGPLTRLPLEVLTRDLEGRPLGARLRIVYGPSASALATQVSEPRRRAFDRTVLALGAPRLDGEQRTGAYREPLHLAALPHAREEARYVARLYRPEGATLLVGDDATLERWIGARPERYRYLHFATHAVVSDRRPERTHLVLTDGVLDLATIRRQKLRADLVTVSACESAVGMRVRGEGIVGLPHAFLASGVRGAVVALWRVEDRSAAEFMRDFYRELHRGLPVAQALRTVREAWSAGSGARSHPARWAPFIQVGGLSPDSP